MIYLLWEKNSDETFSHEEQLKFSCRYHGQSGVWEIEDNAAGRAWALEKVHDQGGTLIREPEGLERSDCLSMMDKQAEIAGQMRKTIERNSRQIRKSFKKERDARF